MRVTRYGPTDPRTDGPMDVRGTPPQCSMIEGVKEKEKSGSVDNEIEDGKIGICVGEEDLKMRGKEKDLICRLNAIGICGSGEEGKVKDVSDLKYRMTTRGR